MSGSSYRRAAALWAAVVATLTLFGIGHDDGGAAPAARQREVGSVHASALPLPEVEPALRWGSP